MDKYKNMKISRHIILGTFVLVCVSFFSSIAHVSNLKIDAKQALLIDLLTGKILYDKNANELVPPSSMSKIMTVYIVMREIKKGNLTLDDTFQVSKKAWKTGGSRTFLKLKSNVSVRDLLYGVIVQSGNDAATALAEGVAGSEEEFVEIMNKTAKEIGANTANFTNATGWPDKEHMMTMRDLAVVATRTMTEFPEMYAMYAEKEFTHNKIRQPNRNSLLYDNVGCDGLKTGHTDSGGYGVVASTVQKGRRLLLVVNGCKTRARRAQVSRKLVNWGYRYFASTLLYTAGQTVEIGDVWLGKKSKIPLISESDIAITVPRHQSKDVKVEVVYRTPLEAPIKVGDKVAKVLVHMPDKSVMEHNLLAGEAVEKAGFFSRIGATFNYLVFGS